MKIGDKVIWKPSTDISDDDITYDAEVEGYLYGMYKIFILSDKKVDVPRGINFYDDGWVHERWVSIDEITRDYKYYREIKLNILDGRRRQNIMEAT